MKKLNPIAFVGILLLLAIIMIPSILVLPFSDDSSTGKLTETTNNNDNSNNNNNSDNGGAVEYQNLDALLVDASSIDVDVYRAEKDTVETVPLEQYIVGVVGAEMPGDFEEEALKAQSLAARTFVVKLLMGENKQVGILKGADISDTVTHQVYKNEEELKTHWGANYTKNIEKVRKAVFETKGQILVYEDTPISAHFFSTSNGYTENAENYWSNPVPYLVSVESPWDQEAPKFSVRTEIPVSEFERKLGVTISNSNIGEITSRTESNRVETVKVGGKEFSGREIRETLGLRSTDFTWEQQGNTIIITTKGYGHGIGMSQYGANFMAQEGKTFDEIVKHYYKGVEISDGNKYLEQYVVRK